MKAVAINQKSEAVSLYLFFILEQHRTENCIGLSTVHYLHIIVTSVSVMNYELIANFCIPRRLPKDAKWVTTSKRQSIKFEISENGTSL